MKYFWLGLARYNAMRARRIRASAAYDYGSADSLERGTRRLLKSARRYDQIKKKSEKYFLRAKGRV